MITDARALKPEYVPRDLHHRNGQIDQLSNVLQPITAGEPGEHTFIFGPTGTGKTTIARYVLSELEREALDFRWGHINCMETNSKAAVLYSLLRDAGRGGAVQFDGTPTARFIEEFRDLDRPFVAVVDEVDVLDDPTTLSALYAIEPVTLIMITIEENEFFTNLDSRVRSRLRGAEKLTLEKYSHAQLSDIIWDRVRVGLVERLVDPGAIDVIADKAAGDARFAIALLRRAARQVQYGEADRLDADVVEEIEHEAIEDVTERHLGNINTHQRLLYDIIRKAGEIDAGTLHARYEDRAGSPKTERTRRRYLKSLERYNLIRITGEKRWRTYHIASYSPE